MSNLEFQIIITDSLANIGNDKVQPIYLISATKI